MDEDPEVFVDAPDGTDTFIRPDVADGPGELPVGPGAGAGMVPASDVMETVAFSDATRVDGIDLPRCDCERDVVVLLMSGLEPP